MSTLVLVLSQKYQRPLSKLQNILEDEIVSFGVLVLSFEMMNWAQVLYIVSNLIPLAHKFFLEWNALIGVWWMDELILHKWFWNVVGPMSIYGGPHKTQREYNQFFGEIS